MPPAAHRSVNGKAGVGAAFALDLDEGGMALCLLGLEPSSESERFFLGRREIAGELLVDGDERGDLAAEISDGREEARLSAQRSCAPLTARVLICASPKVRFRP